MSVIWGAGFVSASFVAVLGRQPTGRGARPGPAGASSRLGNVLKSPGFRRGARAPRTATALSPERSEAPPRGGTGPEQPGAGGRPRAGVQAPLRREASRGRSGVTFLAFC